jgi:uncharacterized phage protein (TIGR02216 family)
MDWPALLRLALGRLRLSPDAFWTMTPAEFRAALHGAGLGGEDAGALARDRLAALMRAHPDRQPDHEDAP